MGKRPRTNQRDARNAYLLLDDGDDEQATVCVGNGGRKPTSAVRDDPVAPRPPISNVQKQSAVPSAEAPAPSGTGRASAAPAPSPLAVQEEPATQTVSKAQIDFLKTAIADTQETIRFLDTKAGMIVAFESVLLSGAMFEAGGLEFVQLMRHQGLDVFLTLSVLLLVAFSILIVYHVQLTLRAIFPAENPSSHVRTGPLAPPNTFFLWELDERGMMKLSVSEYFAKLTAMTDADVALELSSQLLKLSYMRRNKQDILSKSFIWLFGLVIGFMLLQALRILAHVMYQVPVAS